MIIQIHGRNPIDIFSWVVQDFKSSPAKVRPLSVGRSRLRNLIFVLLSSAKQNKFWSIYNLTKISEKTTWFFSTCFFHLSTTAEKLESSQTNQLQAFRTPNQPAKGLRRMQGCLWQELDNQQGKASMTADRSTPSDATRLSWSLSRKGMDQRVPNQRPTSGEKKIAWPKPA